MIFPGLTSDADIDNVLAYLKSVRQGRPQDLIPPLQARLAVGWAGQAVCAGRSASAFPPEPSFKAGLSRTIVQFRKLANDTQAR